MKHALQWTVAILSLLPLTFGTLGLVFGVEFYISAEAATPNLDSQFRFTSGWDVGLALVVWWLIPNIERNGSLFRLVCFAVFLGGLGRLAAWYVTGRPATLVLLVTAIELAIPLLIPWQAAIAREAPTAPGQQ